MEVPLTATIKELKITAELPELIITEVPIITKIYESAQEEKTGQTTSYYANDDGDLQEGREVDFFTLDFLNPFGNNNRFTDEFGTLLFTSGIVINWSSFNGDTVTGWQLAKSASLMFWEDAIDDAMLLSLGTYTTGWRIPTPKEFMSILNYGTGSARMLTYTPFNDNSNDRMWTSTTYDGAPTNAVIVGNQVGVGITVNSKIAGNTRYKACRKFTWTGSALT